MSARSLALSAILAALPLSLAADAAQAQQRLASRFVRAASETATATVAVPEPATALALADSAARYRHTAQVQRMTGRSLVVVGLGAVAAAYVQFARAGRQGMNGAQRATFAAGTIAGVVGASRWASSRDNMRIAARWDEARLAAQR